VKKRLNNESGLPYGVIDELAPMVEKMFMTSNYLSGGLIHKILESDFAKRESAAQRYTHYYGYSYLAGLGVNTIYSPHSNIRENIDAGLIRILHYFNTPKYVRDFLSEEVADTKLQNRLYSLIKNKFLFLESVDQDRAFNLLYVELDPNTVCNHACIYCPVASAPRKKDEIAEELFDDILAQLESLKSDTDITICLCAYNEVTLDKRYPLFVKKIRDKGFKHIVISNGSNLDPPLVDKLVDFGVKDVELNIPALDVDEFYRLVGNRGIKKIMRNVDYMAKKPLNVNILVHGIGNVSHHRNYNDLKKRFKDTPITVSMGATMDRSGLLENEYKCNINHNKLAGCTNAGSRLINWVHINSKGECFLCPMDYNYKYMIGDVKQSSIEEILSGDNIALLRRYSYGLEPAPADFMCRKCAALLSVSWDNISENDMQNYKRETRKSYFKHKFQSVLFRSSLYLKSTLIRK
jgi:MoaA/NifB/PqqE/SkfB family radical SAM enzyme